MNNAKESNSCDTAQANHSGNTSILGAIIGAAALLAGSYSLLYSASKSEVAHSITFFIIAIFAVYFPKIYKFQLKKLGISLEQFKGLETKVDTSLEQSELIKNQISNAITESKRLHELTINAEKKISDLQDSFISSKTRENSLATQLLAAKNQGEQIDAALGKATDAIAAINKQIESLSKIEKDFNIFLRQTLAMDYKTSTAECIADYLPGAYPNDPRKGQFGGKSQCKGLILEADVRPAESAHGFFTLSLTVRSTSTSTMLNNTVCFYLHDSFKPDIMPVTPQSNRAELTVLTYGAFTVGVSTLVGNETVELELDLEYLENAPEIFKRS